jgi:hypothetical protein
MKRRTFLKTTGSTGLLTLLTPTGFLQTLATKTDMSLESSFINPAAEAKPQTWWHWMNGNVTREGITLDLEAMKEAGLGGFQNFDAGTGIPEGPVTYLSKEWLSLKKHAISEAQRLGLEFTMHNCPGWSSSGGPWINPDMSMQQMTWTEAVLEGGKEVRIKLQQPFSLLNYYNDAVVLAFPSANELPGSQDLTYRKVTTNKGIVDVARFNQGNDKGLTIEPEAQGKNAWVQFEYSEAFEARSLTLYTAAIGGGFGPSVFMLESSADGLDFTKVTDIRGGGGGFGGSSDALATAAFTAVKAKYFRLVSSGPRHLSNVYLSGARRLENWVRKANFSGTTDYIGNTGSSQSADSFQAIDPASVIDISSYMNKEGELYWTAPPGKWNILRIGHTTLGTLNRSAPSTGIGLECDKYSGEALEVHFKKMFQELLPLLEPVAKNGTVGLLIDSYEVGMQNWTPKIIQEFEKRRGYSMISYLPAMMGRIVGSDEISNRFLWDLRRTQADLMADNYYGKMQELCKRYGMKTYTQPYDRGPFEEMQIGSRVDANMGEFWAGLSQLFANNDTMRRTVKLSASIAHTNGQKLVLAEAFTAEPSSGKWQQYPYGMKALGDYMFTQGLNRLTFHRFAHQPHASAIPGMTMGPWGTHFDRTNTWFLKGSAWLKYNARCQALLQQGLFVADIAYLTSEDVPGFTPVRPHELDQTPPEGYDYDLMNAETLIRRVKIQNGRIILPDGMSYRILVLASGTTMTLALLQKIHSLVNAGMVLVGSKPVASPGLSTYKDNDSEFNRLSNELWGEPGSSTAASLSFGKGKIFTSMPIKDILMSLDIYPDFEFSATTADAPINYIHKKISDAEVYFVANRRRSTEDIIAVFRVSDKMPEIWNADTGEIIPVRVYDIVKNRMHIPLQMDPSGSLFLVFRNKAGKATRITSIHGDRMQSITGTITKPNAILYPGLINNFSITCWIKPEIDIALGRKQLGSYAGRTTTEYYAIHPPSGEKLYGKGHVATGLTLGRNGIVLWEREGSDAVDVLVAEVPVSGWTHVAVVYSKGLPSLYVNGILTKTGESSDKVVHPGLNAAYQRDGAMYYNGDMSIPALVPEVLDSSRIQELMKMGLPDAEHRVVETAGSRKGLLFFKEGKFLLTNSQGKQTAITVKDLGKKLDLNSNWTVNFPAGLGAPSTIILENLSSLHKHPNEGVKHFSGTATYRKEFTIAETAIPTDRRLFLELGKVEILAEVKLNGKLLGTLWKPPYRLDVTEAIKAGNNVIEIAVTNLWPNRLIGDEKLPQEAEYVSGVNAGNYSVLSNGAIKKLPEWYATGKPKPPGGRVTFTTWQHYHADSPLLESGLIGKVVLRTALLIQV